MRHKIIGLMPQHHIYCEAFGGGAQVLFAKPFSNVEYHNDLDSGLVHFFRVLRDAVLGKELHRRLDLTPYSRQEYTDCLRSWDEQEDPVEKALRWFVVARQSFSGIFGNSWGLTVNSSANGMSAGASRWQSAIELLHEAARRLLRVTVEHLDFRRLLKIYDTPDTLFYLDPPYVPETRKGGKYTHEMTKDDHHDLVDMVLQLKGMVILSGYDNPVYAPLLEHGWSRERYNAICNAAGRTRSNGLQGIGNAKDKLSREECVWLSSNNKGKKLFTKNLKSQ